MATPPHETRIALIDALVALSATDLPYGDLYLHHAQELLEPVLSPEHYRALCHEREGLARTARELRAFAARGDWRQVRALAQRGLHERQRMWENQRLVALGDAVYAPRLFHADPTGLALTGFSVDSIQHLGAARDACMARLRFALVNDGELADFYRERLACLAARAIAAGAATEVVQDTADLPRRIVEAADSADFAQAERLSAALLRTPANGAGHGPEAAPVRSASPAPSLAVPFPDAVVRRAEAIGLTAATLAADATLGGYMCPYINGATLPEPAASEVHGDPADGRGWECWPGLSVNLRDALDLLRGQHCMSSAGSRYLPTFDAETLLVETFSEREPETPSALLEVLALPRRRGLSRLAIEDAVRSHTRLVCTTLGLDPTRHAVIPIPFDAYLRLAPLFNWGAERQWTHFDGYQLTNGLTLRALVGGDAGYGGPADLCSVARDYESQRIVSRFCIVQRERLTARGG